jgi:hypothetical protein
VAALQIHARRSTAAPSAIVPAAMMRRQELVGGTLHNRVPAGVNGSGKQDYSKHGAWHCGSHSCAVISGSAADPTALWGRGQPQNRRQTAFHIGLGRRP